MERGERGEREGNRRERKGGRDGEEGEEISASMILEAESFHGASWSAAILLETHKDTRYEDRWAWGKTPSSRVRKVGTEGRRATEYCPGWMKALGEKWQAAQEVDFLFPHSVSTTGFCLPDSVLVTGFFCYCILYLF